MQKLIADGVTDTVGTGAASKSLAHGSTVLACVPAAVAVADTDFDVDGDGAVAAVDGASGAGAGVTEGGVVVLAGLFPVALQPVSKPRATKRHESRKQRIKASRWTRDEPIVSPLALV